MQEKIKIVFSWIGPRGPIWNTELPNILSFAGVAEGSNTTSHYYWADDIWNRIFSPRKHLFEMYPAAAIEDNDERPFIVPFSLTWRVEFGQYFCGQTGIMEFAHLPWHLVRLVREQNGYILIDHSVEAFMADNQLEDLHGYFRGIHSLPLNKIIYLTGTMNAQQVYDRFCENAGIPDLPEERLTVVAYPSSLEVFSSIVLENESAEPNYDTEQVPSKLFLMWNRRYRRHRVELALSLESRNLIDKSYVSFSAHEVENPSRSFDRHIDADYLINHDYGLNITHEVIERFRAKLPLVIDGETNVNKMCEDRDNAARPYFQDSLVSIVTETNWSDNEITLTEKSFKPIKEKHPFIIVGVPGVLKSMRELGFQTFNEFWNEAYDEIECPQQRMLAISCVCEEISRWSPEQIKDFRRKVKPILEHNWQLLKRPISEVAVKKIVDHIEGTKK